MGSMVEINDTLQIDAEQGWPKELDLATHLKTPYTLKDVEGKIFEFKNKPHIRVYKQPPVRNFLAQNIGGKFKIIRLNSPEQMKQAFHFLDVRPELDYFA